MRLARKPKFKGLTAARAANRAEDWGLIDRGIIGDDTILQMGRNWHHGVDYAEVRMQGPDSPLTVSGDEKQYTAAEAKGHDPAVGEPRSGGMR